MFKISETAAQKIKEVLAKHHKPDAFLRISIISGGCAGFEYKFDIEDQPSGNDLIVKEGDAKVLLDGHSALYLSEAELQWRQSLMKTGFEVANSEARVTCRCGESFAF